MNGSRITPFAHMPRRGASPRRAFTLVELIIAVLITAFLLGSLATSVGQLSRARDTGKLRLDAHLRADAALSAIRRDIASIVRHEDLFWTRLLILDNAYRTPHGEEFDRGEILVFNTRLRAIHDLDFHGEGMQYETQYRIEDYGWETYLWQRRDAVPDENPLGGGIATPMVESIIGLRFEAFDGYQWFSEWDSDYKGLPQGVRITVLASGARPGEDVYDAPRAVMRTVVAIDRVIPPLEPPSDVDEEEEEELEDVSDPTVGTGPTGAPGDLPGAPGTGDSGPQDPRAPDTGAPRGGGRDAGGRGTGGRGAPGGGRGGGAGPGRGGGGATGGRQLGPQSRLPWFEHDWLAPYGTIPANAQATASRPQMGLS